MLSWRPAFRQNRNCPHYGLIKADRRSGKRPPLSEEAFHSNMLELDEEQRWQSVCSKPWTIAGTKRCRQDDGRQDPETESGCCREAGASAHNSIHVSTQKNEAGSDEERSGVDLRVWAEVPLRCHIRLLQPRVSGSNWYVE